MRIAVVGGGIAGLGAAHVLSRVHDVQIFEREPRAGGHANTVVHDGLALDTGFLVHNVRTYPLLTRLFREYGIATHESDMSFSVTCGGCGLEYSGRRPFAQPANATSPRFLSLLWEIGRWLRTARPEDESQTLAEYLDVHGYSQRFRRHFLVPLTSALWSTAPGRALEFPASYAIRFFANHGMLGFGRFRWRTVTGGSHRYVDAIAARLGHRLRLGAGVRSVRRSDALVELRIGDAIERFDRVVLATHADQALALLEDPTPHERRVLGRFAYTRNDAVLHTDSRFLPRRAAARASWNYRLGDDGRPTITYHLNRLQALDAERDYCLTLNEDVPEEHVLQRFAYEHPLYTVATLRAQRELPRLAGGRTHFAGAYFGNGFHEDGLASGVAVGRALGVDW
jgi:predicted NAD/FAD-binding protein